MIKSISIHFSADSFEAHTLALHHSTITEENLLVGKKLCLESLTRSDFEQIAGISPAIAQRLLSARFRLVKIAHETKSIKAALETIKGIGDKKAVQISERLKICFAQH